MIDDRRQPKKTARLYSITIAGYDAEKFTAPTASAARYKAFKAFRDAGYRIEFRDFLTSTTTRHLGVAV